MKWCIWPCTRNVYTPPMFWLARAWSTRVLPNDVKEWTWLSLRILVWLVGLVNIPVMAGGAGFTSRPWSPEIVDGVQHIPFDSVSIRTARHLGQVYVGPKVCSLGTLPPTKSSSAQQP